MISGITLPNEAWQSKETQKLRQALVERVRVLQASAAMTVEHRRRLADATGSSVSPEMLIDASTLREMELCEALEELAIHEAATDFFKRRKAEAAIERDAATEAHEVVRADVRARLLGIGYIAGRIGAQECIDPGMIAKHPEVFAALQRSQSAASFNGHVADAANLAAIAKVRERINEIKIAALRR